MKSSSKALCLFIFLVISSSVSAFPLIISHRGGGQNFQENTLYSFQKSLELGCDALELDVQVTKDGVVVVYHPNDLKQWTMAKGPVSDYNWEEISALLLNQDFKIPTLQEVLEKFPKTLIIVDMKSLPAEPLVKALINTISDEESKRLLFYSTNAEHMDLIHQKKPHWKTFEKRDLTRQRLLDLNQTGQSNIALTSDWIGFELKRKMVVEEDFALGKGTSRVEFHLWTPEVVSYLKKMNPKVFIVLFGINKKEDFERALRLDVDAIYTDNPVEVLNFKPDLYNEPLQPPLIQKAM